MNLNCLNEKLLHRQSTSQDSLVISTYKKYNQYRCTLDSSILKFSRYHGTMTRKLAHMFIKLCERYATRSNWRGYTYNEEMRGQALLQLSQIGLQFDESKSQNPFAYYTAAITNSFTRILNLEKKNQNIRDDMLEQAGLNPSWTRQNAGKKNPNFGFGVTNIDISEYNNET
jgi:hypothetical protein